MKARRNEMARCCFGAQSFVSRAQAYALCICAGSVLALYGDVTKGSEIDRDRGFSPEAEELSENLVRDGGCEVWEETGPGNARAWNYLTIQCKGTEFTKTDEGRILLPKIHALVNGGCKLLKLEGEDVHSGRHALRQNWGNLYLAPSFPDAFRARDGDVYVVRFRAKGEGVARAYLHVYGDGGAELLSENGSLRKDSWSLIEQRILVTGRGPLVAAPRLTASQEILFDDIFVGRVIREGERKLAEVPPDSQERVAFASEIDGHVVIDGTLDEPGWQKAVGFCGFRSYADQTYYAPSSPAFKVLYDDQSLYVGIEIPLSHAAQVLRNLQSQPLTDGSGNPRPEHDTYTARQSVELFIRPPDTARHYQFVASLDGYRYEGAGKDASWNGRWETAIGTAEDRWFLETRIPVEELGVESVVPGTAWHFNACANRKRGDVATWAAVGMYFHNPAAFGTLLMTDFPSWRAGRPERASAARERILAKAAQLGCGLTFSERLEAVDAFVNASVSDDAAADWESITRSYARLNYADFSYRCMESELEAMEQTRDAGRLSHQAATPQR